MTPETGAPPLLTVRLLELPVELHVRAAAHQDALQREFDVLRAGGDQRSVPARLFALIADLDRSFGGLSDQPMAELAAAIERGDTSVDLLYEVPSAAADAAVQLGSMLEEADEFCRSGELVTLATPPEELSYRRWFLGEFVSQIGGSDPVPWSEHRRTEESPAAEVSPAVGDSGGTLASPLGSTSLPVGWSVDVGADGVVVRPAGELDLQTAPELRDLVQSVRREDSPRVTLDLSAVSFVDSVGLSVIVSAHQRLGVEDVQLHVVVPPRLQRLFEVSGLDQVLDLIR